MKKLFYLALVLLAVGCKEEKPSCKKVMYKVGETEVTTYQWMTQSEAEATFSKYKDVRIFDEKNNSSIECLIKNDEN